jgi:hypothetical protein
MFQAGLESTALRQMKHFYRSEVEYRLKSLEIQLFEIFALFGLSQKFHSFQLSKKPDVCIIMYL